MLSFFWGFWYHLIKIFSLANVLVLCIQFQYFRRIFCSFEINIMNGNKNMILFFLCGRYRQYGLWERYAELYPDGDLVYMIDGSDYSKDWFFAQVTRFEFLQYCPSKKISNIALFICLWFDSFIFFCILKLNKNGEGVTMITIPECNHCNSY